MKELLIDTYFNLVNKYTSEYGKKTIVLIQVGAFFEVYGKSHKLINGYFGSMIDKYCDLCDLKIAPKAKVSVTEYIRLTTNGKYVVCDKDGNKIIYSGSFNDNDDNDNNINKLDDNVINKGNNVNSGFDYNSLSIDYNTPVKVIKCNIVMAGFRDAYIEKYLEKMNNAGFTFVIYTQNENDPTSPRELSHIITPGTYFKEDKQELSNNIMVCYIHHKKPSMFSKSNTLYFGVACIDILTGKSNISEHKEQYYKSCQSFNDIEKLCNIYRPNEFIVLFEGSNEGNKGPNKNTDSTIDKIISSISNIVFKITHNIRKIDLSDDTHPFSKRAINCCKQNYQHEIIKQYYSHSYYNYNEICDNIQRNPFMMNAFIFLLDFINKQNSDLVKKIQPPLINSYQEILATENYSLSQLNIINDNRDKSRYSSLSRFLNQCVTNMGKRKIKEIITKPITNINTLNNEYEKVDYIRANIGSFLDIRGMLSTIHDLETFFRKLSLKKITPYDISILYDDLQVINKIHKCMKTHNILEKYNLYDNKKINKSHKEINTYINNFINIPVCRTIQLTDSYQTNFFKRGIYDDVDEIEKKHIETNDILETIQTYFTSLVKNTEKKSKSGEYCKIHETDKSGKSLKITDTRAKKLMDELKKEKSDVIELVFNSSYSNTEQTYLLNIKEVRKEKRGNDTIINSIQINSITSNIELYRHKLKSALKEKLNIFIDGLFNYGSSFEELINFCIELDISINKAYIAYKYNYCKPSINEESENSFLEAKKMRHPLIEHLNKDEIYVAHDIGLGGNDYNKNGILLFGTNAVGKSSLMKALGMCVIMSQCGFFVPCSEYVFKPFTRIFTRILSNDNIFKGLSTFAVEMSELRNIIDNADENSIIIGDELCSGTELGSAISIFIATLVTLHNKNSKFIFATHFHEITKMDAVLNLNKLCMKHLSVYYDAEKDELIYDRVLKDGPGNNKYGLEVCKAMNLKTEFIDLAMNIRNEYIEDIEKPVSMASTSHFNKDVIMSICEICGNKKASEVHHLQHQQHADKDNKLIDYIHKNKKANLVAICNDCHNNIHLSNKQHIKKKTSKGFKIIENH